ncbi:hypothetical protein PGIGA_G00183400 [Pangasianodon gigas]|uniref:Uncharacterized protein n=1 Tax=Pangasianodon gigas TaxID=30993 RepID=A0ACC5WBB5_PANGG|nr:hypothetical protein [Pangasianodon gigas]
MSNPRTLKELTDLKNSRFGRPYPRHGLKLLYWFANDFMVFNNNNKMCWQYNPKNQFYGFHRFKNRKDKNGVKLLPDANLTYYVVGNLNSAGADEMPDYVREDYGTFKNGNNMDRIIISVDDQGIDSVYVTEHSDRTDFNKEATYCISKELIMIIRELTLEDFLSKTGYSRSIMDYGQTTGLSRPQMDYGQTTGPSKPQEDYGQRTGPSKPQEDYGQRTGPSKPQEDYGQRTGPSKPQEDYGQRTGPSRPQKDDGQRTGPSRPQKDYGQRTGPSRPQEDYGQRSGLSRPQGNTDRCSGEDEVTNFWDENESTNCCRCVIL